MSDYTTPPNPHRQQQDPGITVAQLPPTLSFEYALPRHSGPTHMIASSHHSSSYLYSGQCSVPGAVQTDLRRDSIPSHGVIPSIENPHEHGGQASTPSPGSTNNMPNSNNSIDQAASSLVSKPIRRRMRMITSCLECRRRKLKCNKTPTCLNCQKFNRECAYLGPKLDEASQLKLTEMKEKVGSLERQFEQVVVKSAGRAGSAESGVGVSGGSKNTILADDINDELDKEDSLEPTPMVASDLTYEDDADGPDDIIDLGIRVGKMRITERIGGLNRPRLAEEILNGLNSSGQEATVRLILQQQQDMMSTMNQQIDPSTGQWTSIPDFLRPSESYIAPSSGFFFGHILQMPPLLELIPSRHIRLKLMQRFFEAVHPVAPCVHRGSFQALYQSFEDDISNYIEPRPSVQAVVFAAWFSAAISLPDDDVPGSYGFTKNDLVTKMKLGAESALSKAHFIRTTKVETLQALVMYLLALCRNEVSRAHSILTGAAIRIAECMGLHRDGELYGLTPLETHVRRLIWHQLCFLDIRTCEAQGPSPGIRRDEYDTQLPLNIDDSELTPSTRGPIAPADHWTPMLLARVRFEINEMMRILWSDRRKLDLRRITLTAVLNKIDSFRKSLAEKYDHMLDENIPIQRYAKQVIGLLTHRLNAMVLHPYHANASNPMPEKLSRLLVYSGTAMIEMSIQLENNPLFREWRWYLGAYQQYQIALLLATEIYYLPTHPLANRIWACLDDVFELDPNLEREDKVVKILTEIMTKTAVYTSMRKMRAPCTNTNTVLDRKPAVRTSPTPQPPQLQDFNQPLLLQPPHQNNTLKAEPGTANALMNGAFLSSIPQTQPQQQPQTQGYHPVHSHPQHMQQQQAFPPLPLPLPVMPPNMVFGGVSNGEALWALPPLFRTSPDGTSDEGSPPGHHPPQHQQNGLGMAAQQSLPPLGVGMGGAAGQGLGMAAVGAGAPGGMVAGGGGLEIDWGQIEMLSQDFSFNTMVDGGSQGLGGPPFSWPV